MAYLQILWSQNERRLFPNPLAQFPSEAQAAKIARGKQIFSTKVAQGGAGCADCHHNGNVLQFFGSFFNCPASKSTVK